MIMRLERSLSDIIQKQDIQNSRPNEKDMKAAVGLMTNSIAIVLDAVNNISDAGSSLITIVGSKLAG